VTQLGYLAIKFGIR